MDETEQRLATILHSIRFKTLLIEWELYTLHWAARTDSTTNDTPNDDEAEETDVSTYLDRLQNIHEDLIVLEGSIRNTHKYKLTEATDEYHNAPLNARLQHPGPESEPNNETEDTETENTED